MWGTKIDSFNYFECFITDRKKECSFEVGRKYLYFPLTVVLLCFAVWLTMGFEFWFLFGFGFFFFILKVFLLSSNNFFSLKHFYTVFPGV